MTDGSDTSAKPASSSSAKSAQGKELTKDGATRACADAAETKLKGEHPGSKVKVHWIAGVVAQTKLQENAWRVTIEASVDKNDGRAQCLVTGTDDKPTVESVAWR